MATSRHATYADEDLVHLYLVDVGRHPLLTKPESGSARSAKAMAKLRHPAFNVAMRDQLAD